MLCTKRDLLSTEWYTEESGLVLLCSGDIPDFSVASADNSLSCFLGDLGACSVTGDEDLDRLPLGDD